MATPTPQSVVTNSRADPAGTTGLTRDNVLATTGYLRSWLAYRRWLLRVPGIQVAMFFDDDIVLSEAFGEADVERGVAMTTDHLFRVASHSKTFTATALLQLVEAGTLRLDDTLGRWLPFLSDSSLPVARLTLRELLMHASGIIRDGADADFWQLDGPFPDVNTLQSLALGDTQIQPANERFKYSNVGYSLLGLVIEAASGKPYADYVTSELVQRLGLQRTGPELDPARTAEYAVGYSALLYADHRRPVDPVDTRAMAAATGFYSTAEDLCRWFSAHFTGDPRLLTEESKRLMQHQWWSVDGSDGGGYGLGFSVAKAGERRLLGHGGGFPGQLTRTVFDPVDRLAVSVLTNAVDGPPAELALGVVKLLDLATRQRPDPAEGKDRFCVRMANLWGVSDVTLLGGRLLLLDPTADDPSAEGTYSELTVESPTRLRVTSGRGYGAVGEPIDFTFAGDDSITSVHGPGGMTSWPLDSFRLPTGSL